MMLDLNGTLVERTQEDPLGILSQLLGDGSNTYGLDDILSSIRKAKENEDIKGIYIQATSLGAGFASLEEIRDALKDFKESGKFIVAYGDTYTQNLYYLSSVADKVLLNPQGMLEWRGLAATPMFFKDLLEKIGVEMQIFKVGTYKSAVEPFISTEMSPANREQVNVYLSSIWGQITSSVAESRNLSVEALNKEADRMLMFYPAEESVKNGLVDTLIYKNDVRDYLKNMVGIDKDDNMPVLGIQDMINVKKNVPRDKSGNVIAVYYAYGEIDGGSSASTDEGINSEKVIKDLRKLNRDFSDMRILRALATAGLIGNIVKHNASISGAEAGCQAEVGVACSMASAAASQLFGGSPAQIEYAAEMGLEHHLGMTCDPVCGLVQIPCIERNAYAAARALDANLYSSFTDGMHRVSFDKVVEVMKETGNDLPSLYKETSEGGLAKDYKPM